MKPTIAPHNKQKELFYLAPVLHAHSTASARNAYGTAAQEVVCRTMGLNPIPINGNFDVCFDAELNGQFYEIKSVRTSGKIVVYDWRMKKEEIAAPSLRYLILVHKLKAARIDILKIMSNSEVIILNLPATFIHNLCKQTTLNKHKNYQGLRNGYSRVGYKDGYYNLSLKPIMNACKNEQVLTNPFNGPAIRLLTT